MRVVLLVTDHELGGSPLRLARLAQGLSRAGVTVVAGCLGHQGPITRKLRAATIETFACDARGSGDWSALLRLRRHLKRVQPDLIHATLTHANVAARLVGRWIGIPVVSSTATIEVERPLHRRLERLTARLDRGHIVNSQAVARHVASAFRVPEERIFVVPPSIERPAPIERSAARRMFNLPESGFVVVWAGRFDPVKRLDLLLQCASALGEAEVYFLLVGDGRELAGFKQRALTSPAGRRFRLPGWQDSLGSAFSAADAFVLPSLTEGMPNALLEAMAFGLPAVAADIPTLREIACDQERLLLVSDADPASFAAAIRRLRDDQAVRRGLANRAKAWASEQLNPARTIAAALAVYERVLGGEAGG